MTTHSVAVQVGTRSLATLRRQDVGFDQSVAGGVAFAAQNRGSIASRSGDDDGGFAVIGRRFSSRLNFGSLTILPIIIRCDLLAVNVEDGKNRIG